MYFKCAIDLSKSSCIYIENTGLFCWEIIDQGKTSWDLAYEEKGERASC